MKNSNERLNEFLKKQQYKKGELTKHEIDGVIPLHTEILTNDLINGEKTGSTCYVDELEEIFSWMRGFQYCWYGWANDGKSALLNYLAVLLAYRANAKWIIWSPEGMSGDFIEGKRKPITHYNDFYKDMINILNPGYTVYHKIHNKYGIPLISQERLDETRIWIEKHFITVHPKDKTPEGVLGLFRRIYEFEGFDGMIVDPFKNVRKSQKGGFIRDDQYLDYLFADFKEFAIETNSYMNWIAHPRNKEGINKHKLLKEDMLDSQGMIIASEGDTYTKAPIQDNIMGGGAWDNGMDVIMRVHRPFQKMYHDVNKLTKVWLTNEKQKKQIITNSKGDYRDINYNIKTQRYVFNGVDPLGN